MSARENILAKLKKAGALPMGEPAVLIITAKRAFLGTAKPSV
ncbi:Uncharacterised protein [Neisseria gonorrhoeae]|uniref:Uncharacterized protein n=1 Tax=Neisseria gonorrhoeae TaxID=485 RepID=A0A378VWA1_NEIGO|nr:Uncharacterised protein [Neisseria gonorrhoeae]